MDSIHTIAKCLGIIGIFILPLFAITIGYYLLVSLVDSGNLANFHDFISSIGRNLLPGSL